jgi:hypothetical protein
MTEPMKMIATIAMDKLDKTPLLAMHPRLGCKAKKYIEILSLGAI